MKKSIFFLGAFFSFMSLQAQIGSYEIWRTQMPDNLLYGASITTSVTPLNIAATSNTSGLTVQGVFSNQVYTNVGTYIDDNSVSQTVQGAMFGLTNNNLNNIKQFVPQEIGVNFNSVGTPGVPSPYYASPSGNLSGISVLNNGAFNITVSAEGLTGLATDGRYPIATLTYTFNKPVDYPILHVTGIGAIMDVPEVPSTLVWHAQFEMLQINGAATTSTFTKLNGSTHAVLINGGTTIINNRTTDDFILDGFYGTDGDYAGTGSFRVNATNVTSVSMRVYVKGTEALQVWTTDIAPPPPGGQTTHVINQDRLTQSWTIENFTFTGQVVVDNTANNPGTISGSPYTGGGLNAILVNEQGQVVQSVPVSTTDGTFGFTTVLGDNYTVLISPSTGTVGSAPPTAAAPAGYYPNGNYFGANNTTPPSDNTPLNSTTDAYGINHTTVNGTPTTPSLIFGISETVVLPIEHLRFGGILEKNDAHLSWTTTSEINNKGYDVEYSQDGKKFEKIGWVEGNGTTTAKQDYSYVHKGLSNGVHYYRLKQYDLDGQIAYSKEVVRLKLNSDQEIKLYPNPTNEAVSIEFIEGIVGEPIQINVYAADGRLVYERDVKEAGKIEKVDLSGNASGTYTVKVAYPGGTFVRIVSLK